MTHYLKTWPDYYLAIVAGEKRFEIRRNDRDFKCGDLLILQEYAVPHADSCDCGCDVNNWKDGESGLGYTGRETTVRITSILFKHDGLLPGFVILGIATEACSAWIIIGPNGKPGIHGACLTVYPTRQVALDNAGEHDYVLRCSVSWRIPSRLRKDRP